MNKKVAVITDNDHDYNTNILKNYSKYESDEIKIFAEEDNAKNTFEVSLYENNNTFIDKYLANANMTNGVQNFMLKNKAESAFRLLSLFTDVNPDTNIENFTIPTYIKEAIIWIAN